MTRKTRLLLCTLLTLAVSIGVLVSYSHLPDQIPSQWNINGIVSYGPRRIIWLLPAMMLFFNILLDIVPKIDPKKNYMKFMKEYNLFCVFMNLFFAVLTAALELQALRPGLFDMRRLVWFSIGVLFLITGNIMPKFKPNFFSGIRTPWALADDENWKRTHRLGGKLFFLAGVVWIISAAVASTGQSMLVLGMGSLLAACLIPYAMSYYWWRKKETR